MQNKLNKKYKKALKIAQQEKYNQKQVYDLLLEAISENSGDAMYALATWYLFGEYVVKNYKTGNQLLERATQLHIPQACFDLAISYEKGIGIEKNFAKAFSLYVKGALYGDNGSFEDVGRCYNYGIGVQENKDLAQIWYEKAESLGVELRYDDEE